MIRLALCGLALLQLSACGADGEPVRPSAPAPGISITGEARMGVVTRQ